MSSVWAGHLKQLGRVAGPQPIPTPAPPRPGGSVWAAQVARMQRPTGAQAKAAGLPVGRSPYDTLIYQAAQRYGLNPNILRSMVKVESSFNPQAKGRDGEMGLMQLMPATARGLGVQNPWDPGQNIDGGARYLRQQLDRFGTYELAVAAYNAGPGRTAKAPGIPLPEKTRGYVQKVLSGAAGPRALTPPSAQPAALPSLAGQVGPAALPGTPRPQPAYQPPPGAPSWLKPYLGPGGGFARRLPQPVVEAGRIGLAGLQQPAYLTERGIGRGAQRYYTDDPFERLSPQQRNEVGRVVYSWFGNPEKMESITRRLEAGEEMQDVLQTEKVTWRELVGQILLDPLNLIGFVLGKAKKGKEALAMVKALDPGMEAAQLGMRGPRGLERPMRGLLTFWRDTPKTRMLKLGDEGAMVVEALTKGIGGTDEMVDVLRRLQAAEPFREATALTAAGQRTGHVLRLAETKIDDLDAVKDLASGVIKSPGEFRAALIADIRDLGRVVGRDVYKVPEATFAETLLTKAKQAMSLAFLGYNPGYGVQGVLSNEVIPLLHGKTAWSTPGNQMKYLAKFYGEGPELEKMITTLGIKRGIGVAGERIRAPATTIVQASETHKGIDMFMFGHREAMRAWPGIVSDDIIPGPEWQALRADLGDDIAGPIEDVIRNWDGGSFEDLWSKILKKVGGEPLLDDLSPSARGLSPEVRAAIQDAIDDGMRAAPEARAAAIVAKVEDKVREGMEHVRKITDTGEHVVGKIEQVADDLRQAGIADEIVDIFSAARQTEREAIQAAKGLAWDAAQARIEDASTNLGLMRRLEDALEQLNQRTFDTADQFRARVWQENDVIRARPVPYADRRVQLDSLWENYRVVQDRRFRQRHGRAIRLIDTTRGMIEGGPPALPRPGPMVPPPRPRPPAPPGAAPAGMVPPAEAPRPGPRAAPPPLPEIADISMMETTQAAKAAEEIKGGLAEWMAGAEADIGRARALREDIGLGRLGVGPPTAAPLPELPIAEANRLAQMGYEFIREQEAAFGEYLAPARQLKNWIAKYNLWDEAPELVERRFSEFRAGMVRGRAQRRAEMIGLEEIAEHIGKSWDEAFEELRRLPPGGGRGRRELAIRLATEAEGPAKAGERIEFMTVPLDIDTLQLKRLREAVSSQVEPAARDLNYAATQFGLKIRQDTLLDYSHRANFDWWLNWVFPYQYWYTRTGLNMAKHMVSRPGKIAAYYRLKQGLEEVTNQPGFPTRMKGKVRIRLPFLPDWMGDELFIDPLKTLTPIPTFLDPYMPEYEDETGFAKAYRRLGGIMSPAPWLTYPLAAAGALGPAERTISGPQIPLARGIKGVTGLLGIGPPGGVSIAPVRRMFGLPAGETWDPYRTDRMLSNMAQDGLITTAQAKQAAAMRSGPIYEQAQRRADQERGVTLTGSMLGMRGLSIYPTGERETRRQRGEELYPALEKAAPGFTKMPYAEKEAWRAANPAADDRIRKVYSEFYQRHPEQEAYSFAQKEPRERLIDMIWDAYNERGAASKREAKKGLGEKFATFFIGKETRDYSKFTDQELSRLAQGLGWGIGAGVMPQQAPKAPGALPEQPGAELRAIPEVPPEIDKDYEAFLAYIDENFPADIRDVQREYFALPERSQQRRSYLVEHPELQRYWEGTREFKRSHPQFAQWYAAITGGQVPGPEGAGARGYLGRAIGQVPSLRRGGGPYAAQRRGAAGWVGFLSGVGDTSLRGLIRDLFAQHPAQRLVFARRFPQLLAWLRAQSKETLARLQGMFQAWMAETAYQQRRAGTQPQRMPRQQQVRHYQRWR